ncbi:beta-lactamase [Diplodia corticola]|uniref:Beta-lactamase n=1 Tax=Diplodia corticola TaxID=236234 RepID=A0A1J9QVD6_9PEZI|nr:beta-lactamase [Diplodia corticola]OJD32950.1 beta-lactamase [Diplodia corticola]
MRSQALPLVFSILAGLLEPTASLPTGEHGLLSQRSSVPQFEVYHGVDLETHQTHYDDLSGKGYRVISLSAYGNVSNAQYAAVWVQRSGPAFTAIHNANASAFQSWVDERSTAGYVPSLVAVTGPGESAVFSGVMEAGRNTTWTQTCNMTQDQFAGNDQRANSLRQGLTSFRQYGTPGDYRFCAIWHANPLYDKWTAYTANTPAAGFRDTIDTETSKPYWRPASLSIADDGSYTSLWADTSIGSWDLQYDLAAADLDAEIERQKASGKYPVHLSGGGGASSSRYAAVFATQDTPSKRTWRVTGGAATGFADNTAVEAKAESLMQDFMQNAGVRQVQLAIARNGSTLLNKAYTWSEPERATTSPTDTFLLASNSKAFCAAAISSLFAANRLQPNATVYPLLNYTGAYDSRSDAITVQQLLDHTAGFKRSVSGDPAYEMRDIALAQTDGARAATLSDVIDYMYRTQALDYTPGAGYEYGNYAYMLLSRVVEAVAGVPYWDYLSSAVLQPDGLAASVVRWNTSSAAHVDDGVVQESRSTGLSALAPLDPLPVAHVFGGDGQVKESCLGATGLAASADALARFAARHAVYGVGARSFGWRDGTTSGARTYVNSRADGLDVGLTINTRDFPNGDGDFEGVTAAVSRWLSDLPYQ